MTDIKKGFMGRLGRLFGWQDYRVEITYTYGTQKLVSAGNVLARNGHHAISLFMMQEMSDPHGPEFGWEYSTSSATVVST